MKIFLVSGNFLGKNNTKEYRLIKTRGAILFSYYYIQAGWQTIKIFNYFKTNKWDKK